MNFFPIYLGTCSGTKIFEMLATQARAARALLHLGVMVFLATGLIVACNWLSIEKEVTGATNFLQEQCGGISLTPTGIRPVTDSGKAKSFLVTSGFEFRYTPAEKIVPADISIHKNAGTGIIWSPGIIAFWRKVADDQYTYLPLIYSPAKLKLSKITMTAVELSALLNSVASEKGPYNFKFETLNITTLGQRFVPVISIALFVLFYIVIGFWTVFFALVFSSVFGFTGKRSFRSVPWSRLFAIVIYASFPPITVASLFPALNLPYIDYQTVFLVCYVSYLMVVLIRVEKTLMPVNPEDDSKSY